MIYLIFYVLIYECNSLKAVFKECAKLGLDIIAGPFKLCNDFRNLTKEKFPGRKLPLHRSRKNRSFIIKIEYSRKYTRKRNTKYTDKRTDVWSRPSCIYTQVYSPKKPVFFTFSG